MCRNTWGTSLIVNKHPNFPFIHDRSERVDQLAYSAVMEAGEAMDWADTISAITTAGQTKNFTDNCESALLSRMKELGIELWGGIKKRKLIKSSRHMVNQQRLGVISYCLLMEMMNRRPDCQWVCLEYMDDYSSK